MKGLSVPDRTLSPHAGLAELRRTRTLLRSEMTTLVHWRRLIRARIDLAVATVLLPDQISPDVREILPLDHHEPLPEHEFLAQMVRGSSTTSEVFQLGELRKAEKQLLEYSGTVRRSLEFTTSQLVFRLAQDPYSAITLLRPTS